MRGDPAHAQATDVGDIPATPEMRVTAARHAGRRVRVVVVEGGKQANVPDGHRGLAGIAEHKLLIQSCAAQLPGYANLQRSQPVNDLDAPAACREPFRQLPAQGGRAGHVW